MLAGFLEAAEEVVLHLLGGVEVFLDAPASPLGCVVVGPLGDNAVSVEVAVFALYPDFGFYGGDLVDGFGDAIDYDGLDDELFGDVDEGVVWRAFGDEISELGSLFLVEFIEAVEVSLELPGGPESLQFFAFGGLVVLGVPGFVLSGVCGKKFHGVWGVRRGGRCVSKILYYRFWLIEKLWETGPRVALGFDF